MAFFAVVVPSACGAAAPVGWTATNSRPRVARTAPSRLAPGVEPYVIKLPAKVSAMPVPADNPLTVPGVELGRWLFYDPILSGNNTQSCADCHQQSRSFTDGRQVAIGSEGKPGRRNTSPLVNLAWQTSFFWDGRARTLEDQALMPIQDPLELNQDVDALLEELREHPDYPRRFEAAFPGGGVTRENLAKALAQFLRALVSFDAKIDRIERGEYTMNEAEAHGMYVLRVVAHDEPGGRGDCDDCHVPNSGLAPGLQAAGLFLNNDFRNNGVGDARDHGRKEITGRDADEGRFKVPSLRNVAVTGPYMHDGRFATLREVLEHYNALPDSEALDDSLKVEGKPLRMEIPEEVIDALLDLAGLYTDEAFLSNPAFSNPFEAEKHQDPVEQAHGTAP